MEKKRYRLLRGLVYEFTATVNGGNVRISFSGGRRSPDVIRGSYSTTDKTIQEAIESHGGFGSIFKLEAVIELETTVVEVPKTITEKADKKKEDKGDINISGIPDFQSARTYLKKQYPNEKPTTFQSIPKVKEFCKKEGIVFDDWK